MTCFWRNPISWTMTLLRKDLWDQLNSGKKIYQKPQIAKHESKKFVIQTWFSIKATVRIQKR